MGSVVKLQQTMSNHWKSTALQSLKSLHNNRRQVALPNIIQINYRFQITWPFFNMAPHNLPNFSNALTPCKHRTPSPTHKREPVLDVNWQKAVIQSSVVENFYKNWNRIRDQSWIEQMYMMIKETPVTFSSIICMIMLCLCIVPVVTFLTLALSSFFVTLCSFVFVEGTLLTVGTLILGGLLSVVFFVAFPFIVVVVTIYFFVSAVFKLLSSTSSQSKRTMVVRESQVPMCIVDSDATILRRAHTKPFTQLIDPRETKML